MKKCLSILLTIVISIILYCSCAFSKELDASNLDFYVTDNSVLIEVYPGSTFSEQLTQAFIREYIDIDYKHYYNQNTDKIVVNYIGKTKAYPDEEQYEIKYYSVRNLGGTEVGYIGACIEETAWSLWGHHKTGIRPIVFSGYQYDESRNPIFRCLYGFGYSNNLEPDEYGNNYYYEKFKAQTYNDIDNSPGYPLWQELGGQTGFDIWQEKEKGIVFNSYVQTREYINKENDNASYDKQQENITIIQTAYFAEELLGKSATEIIAIYGSKYIEVVPEGDPPYFYYEDGDPYRFVGNSRSAQITMIKAYDKGCCIIPGAYIGDSIAVLEAAVLNSGKYTYWPETAWYYGANGEYGWVHFYGNSYSYSCYIENKIVVAFDCSIYK